LTRAATLAAICAFLYLALARVGEDRARSNLKFLVFGPGVMAAISLSLFALGVQIGSVGVLASGARASHGEAEMLSALGVHVDRLALPLFESGNGGGAVGAIALAVGFMMIRRREPQLIRAAAGLSIVAGVAVTLISDSRGPLLAGVVAVILVWLLPRASKRLLTAIPLLIPFAPMIIIFVTTKLLSGQSAALSREGTDLATATGRSYVWSDVFEVVTRLDVDNLFGYGAFGQVRSGAGATYAYLFNVPQPQFTNAHNAVLQTALDSGWIGVVALIAVFVVSITSVATLASDRNQSVGRALLAGLVVFSMVAADEAIPTLNLLYLLAMFLAFTFAAFVAPTVRLYEPEHIELEESELELSSRLDPVLN
jgi:hypothetical protein